MSVSQFLCICMLSVVLAKCVDCMPPSMQIGLGRNELIRLYFSDGYSYKSIVEFLYVVHNILLSIRHLKRILARRRRVPILSHGRFNRIVKHTHVSK